MPQFFSARDVLAVQQSSTERENAKRTTLWTDTDDPTREKDLKESEEPKPNVSGTSKRCTKSMSRDE